MANTSRLRGQIDKSFSEKVQTITDSVKLHENGKIELTDLTVPFEFSRIIEQQLGRSMALDEPIDATLGFDDTTGKLFLESAALKAATPGEVTHITHSKSLPSYLPSITTGNKIKSGYIPLVSKTSDELLEAANIPPLSKDSTETELSTWRHAILSRASYWSIISSVDLVHDVDPQLLTVLRATREEHQEPQDFRNIRRVEKIIYTPIDGDETTLTAHAILETEADLTNPAILRAYQKLYLADTSLYGMLVDAAPDEMLEPVDLLDEKSRYKYNTLASDAFKAFVNRVP